MAINECIFQTSKEKLLLAVNIINKGPETKRLAMHVEEKTGSSNSTAGQTG